MSKDPIVFNQLSLEDASPKAKSLLQDAQKRMGQIPNIYSMMAHSSSLLETYTRGDQLFRQSALFDPTETEIIYLTISKENSCRYCVAVHSTLADSMSHVPTDITDAIRQGKRVENPKYGILISITRSLIASRGQLSAEEKDDFISAGYTQHHLLDIIHAIAIKTISNYANHLFNTPLDPVFRSRKWPDD